MHARGVPGAGKEHATEACQEHGRNMQGACQTARKEHARSMPHACQMQASSVPGAHQKHARSMPEAR